MLLLAALVDPSDVLAQPVSTAGGAIRISVTALPSEQPLPYAVVSVPQLPIERFTDAQGGVVLAGVPAGVHDVVVRRIGFVQFRSTVVVVAGQTTLLNVRLYRVAYRLANVTVRSSNRCRTPGLPDSAASPDVFALIGLASENADRFRLLAQQHPFSYQQARALGSVIGDSFKMRRIDSLVIASVASATYRPGELVRLVRGLDGSEERTLVFPSILDLVDSAFTSTHCFGYAGVVQRNGETWQILDVRADENLHTPDVDARFYLDSATSALRQMDLTLTKASALPRDSRGVGAITVTTSFVEIASGIAIIDKMCAITTLRSASLHGVPARLIELQHLLAYEFKVPPPGVLSSGFSFSPVGWRVDRPVSTALVSCMPK
jgi:Carboxypeptidase regulatory-like domain